jgi:hypothetical protein
MAVAAENMETFCCFIANEYKLRVLHLGQAHHMLDIAPLNSEFQRFLLSAYNAFVRSTNQIESSCWQRNTFDQSLYDKDLSVEDGGNIL